jgi:hypothetical protein
MFFFLISFKIQCWGYSSVVELLPSRGFDPKHCKKVKENKIPTYRALWFQKASWRGVETYSYRGKCRYSHCVHPSTLLRGIASMGVVSSLLPLCLLSLYDPPWKSVPGVVSISDNVFWDWKEVRTMAWLLALLWWMHCG